MLDPKTFYRKLDLLLDKIGKIETTADFFISILQALEHTFGHDLQLHDGHIYEESEDEYILIHPDESDLFKHALPMESRFVKNILEFQTYIFDNPDDYTDVHHGSRNEYAIPVGIVIHSPEFKWMFVFSLKSGWIREQVEFCLNAVRNALNYRLISEHHQNEKLRAKGIQQSLLPLSPPEFAGYQVAGRSIAADIVGGDLYDYFPFEGPELGICIGDASGHGMPAALLVRDVVTGLRMGLDGSDTVSTFQKLNRIIFRSNYSSNFISLFYTRIRQGGHMDYINAGHPPPLLFDGRNFTALHSTGLLFGALREIELIQQHTYLQPGHILFMYSDGIFERQNKRGNQFGLPNIKRQIAENYSKDIHELMDLIFDTVYAFGAPQPWQDDATIVLLRRDW